MPYIGLCGLLPVSFSERAGITAPLMLGGRRHADALEDAARKRAVEVEQEAEAALDEVVGRAARVRRVRHHVARQPEPAVTGDRQEIALAALPARQHVRARHVGAAGEVDADERDLARALHREAAACLQRLEVGRERRLRSARVGEQAEQRRRDDRGRTGDEALRHELTARDGTRVIRVAVRTAHFGFAATRLSLHRCKLLIAAACWRCRRRPSRPP